MSWNFGTLFPELTYPVGPRRNKAIGQRWIIIFTSQPRCLKPEYGYLFFICFQICYKLWNLNLARPAEKQSQANKVELPILEEYRCWKGTRHGLGGTSRQGIYCSGFVKAVYKDVFNISLPRTTKAQVLQGKSISFNELQPGDLVFFKTPNYPRHVGILLNR